MSTHNSDWKIIISPVITKPVAEAFSHDYNSPDN